MHDHMNTENQRILLYAVGIRTTKYEETQEFLSFYLPEQVLSLEAKLRPNHICLNTWSIECKFCNNCTAARYILATFYW